MNWYRAPRRSRASELLAEPDPAIIIVDGLPRVRIQRPRIDIRPVRQLRRIGVQKALHNGASRGIGNQGCALVRQGHERIPVHAAPHPGLTPFEENVGPAPQGRRESEAVVVIVRRLDASHLKERSRTENAVSVRLEQRAVDRRRDWSARHKGARRADCRIRS